MLFYTNNNQNILFVYIYKWQKHFFFKIELNFETQSKIGFSNCGRLGFNKWNNPNSPVIYTETLYHFPKKCMNWCHQISFHGMGMYFMNRIYAEPNNEKLNQSAKGKQLLKGKEHYIEVFLRVVQNVTGCLHNVIDIHSGWIEHLVTFNI